MCAYFSYTHIWLIKKNKRFILVLRKIIQWQNCSQMCLLEHWRMSSNCNIRLQLIKSPHFVHICCCSSVDFRRHDDDGAPTNSAFQLLPVCVVLLRAQGNVKMVNRLFVHIFFSTPPPHTNVLFNNFVWNFYQSNCSACARLLTIYRKKNK